MILVIVYETADKLAIAVIDRLVGTQERNTTVGVDIHCTDEVIGIQSVILTRKHTWLVWLKRYIGKDIGCNTCSHALTALGIDDDNTIGSTCTIDGSTILQDLDIADVVYINCREYIVVHTHVDRFVTLLQIPNNTINNNQRLCIGIE